MDPRANLKNIIKMEKYLEYNKVKFTMSGNKLEIIHHAKEKENTPHSEKISNNTVGNNT